MIVVLAGRRIDEANASVKRFPEQAVPSVKSVLRNFFLKERVTHLISSGACGADLVAQQLAMELAIRQTLILPFDKESFRNTSVTDRGGDWGNIYDAILAQGNEKCTITVLEFAADDSAAYANTNLELIRVAKKLTSDSNEPLMALCLWDGIARSADDATMHFKREALTNGITTKEIDTLNGKPMFDISEPLRQRLSAPGPKRMLALDGGGIKGMITLGFLGQIEKVLAERYRQRGLITKVEDFRLHHYFDLIGGTSTGSIIAALLAVGGYSVEEIKKMYLTLGEKIFSSRKGIKLFGWHLYLKRKYDSKPLKDELHKIFQDSRLGDPTNKTGLCVVTKRLDTCSTWPVTNNPQAKYFGVNRFLISEIVRASTAAPSYFEPEEIDVGDGQGGVFVDGGMSIMNNPSLQLFLVATLQGFQLKWQQGEENLLIVSVGTGRRDKKLTGEKYKDPKLWDIAQFAPDQFMSDAGETVEIMMHYLGQGLTPLRKIDSEIQNLANDKIMGQKAFSYARYNVDLVKDELASIGIADLNDSEINSLVEMDRPENAKILLRIGESAAKKYVQAGHFPVHFDS